MSKPKVVNPPTYTTVNMFTNDARVLEQLMLKVWERTGSKPTKSEMLHVVLQSYKG